jgi:hypothetical protein
VGARLRRGQRGPQGAGLVEPHPTGAVFERHSTPHLGLGS